MPLLKDYPDAEKWLLSMTDYERMLGSGAVRYDTRTFDLEHFRDQLHYLGDPHLRYAVIHAAGTKGKGSTCAFLESALRNCGFKTGLYTSPHLYKFTERIKVNGADIPDEDFCRLVQTLGNMIIDADQHDPAENARNFRTVFEILTAAAFSYFAEQDVDIAIVETGLGGRLDSTNVFEKQGNGPLINIITAIGLDHTAILGDTLGAITAEKAGIIQRHARIVVAPQVSLQYETTVADVVGRRCEVVGASAPVFAANTCEVLPEVDEPGCYNFRILPGTGYEADSRLCAALAGGIKICPSLVGEHQAANVATALLALVELEKAWRNIEFQNIQGGTDSPVRQDPLQVDQQKDQFGPKAAFNSACIIAGFEKAIWPGRFQVIAGEIPVVIDGAHCAISAGALARTCRQQFGDRKAVIVTGFLRDKAGADLLGAMFRQLPVVHGVAVVPPTPRAVSADHIRDALLVYLPSESIETADTTADAITAARLKAAQHDAYIVVFGSLYLVGPATTAALV